MKFLRWICYLFCTLVLVIGIGGTVIFWNFFAEELPDHTSLRNYSPQLASRVFLRDGTKLCEYAAEKRYFIPIDKVPKKLINAFLAVEDKHFFEHAGIDFYGIMRSAIKNLENFGTGKRPQGASTITQQVARIFLIKSKEVSYLRKTKEAILSYRIEHSLSKMHILELYLNQIYLGMGCYGVAAAAKVYFDKAPDELTIAECSYLAALAKGAGNYHPVKHLDKAIMRRNWAINRQLEDKYITKQEAQEAIREKFKVVESETSNKISEYFSEEVRKYLIEKFPFESLNKEGLIVRATLDFRIQQYARRALRKGIEEIDRRFGWRGPIARIDPSAPKNNIIKKIQDINIKGADEFLRAAVMIVADKTAVILLETGETGHLVETELKWARKLEEGDVIFVSKSKGAFLIKQMPKVQGAIIVIETNSGRILAMQGGYSFAQSEFNRATQSVRQIGSAFKPFVYLAGLENGFAPNSIIDASPVEINLGENMKAWKPGNYQHKILDKITFRQAIERSVNTATVRIAQEVGIDKVAKIAEQFGLFKLMPRMFSYVLGAGETTLLKLTTAYAIFANGGKKIFPTMVEYVQDKHGKVIYRADTRIVGEDLNYSSEFPAKLSDNRSQILSEQSIYQLTSLLEGVVQRGSGAAARCLNIPVAGKTGTSNDSRDTWFIGYTPDIAVGVFIGFDDHSKSLGKNANGTNTALPIFIDFMTELKVAPKPFRVPRGISLRKVEVTTGGTPSEYSTNTVVEAFKEEDEENSIQARKSIADLLKESDSQKEIKPILGFY
ncbi:MAG: PBP1A family penicillin-binding protein [Holosporaceae bacterium]|jgi:penicillin-binding protein 1A|nr:PBP1A family penicillin-binding protein [Holosporaceae bacterium]